MTDERCKEIYTELRDLSRTGYKNPDGSPRLHRDPSIETKVQARMEVLLPNHVRISSYKLVMMNTLTLYAMMQDSLEKYKAWCRERTKLSRQLPEPASADEIIKAIGEVDLLDPISRGNLCDLLGTDLYSHIDIGTYGKYHYCLRSDLFQLRPEDHDIDWNDEREPMPSCILGINLSKTVPWTGDRRKEHSSDESGSSNISTGNDGTGFVFTQLGRVCYLDDSRRQKYHDDGKFPIQMPWLDSGFVLVVVVRDDGSAGAPWLLFNFMPVHELEGSRFRIPQTDDEWGTLPGSGHQYVALQIGDRISELRFDKQWVMTSRFGGDYSPQLVAVVNTSPTSRGQLVRQKIFENSR
ncbi:uncharacterized protein J4E92_004064 [Alternaria infectoria]|uniref:uncharacterized protein n=1 Tax=Alternaria infectoria TaxID=45303 RepID=UPI00221FE944|nr:uncharacterized protein J4E92_004064 [Alternaria infectoria]KAI4932165.1 hypothetical protein J4E92_004064 [Alternaria infectoria]